MIEKLEEVIAEFQKEELPALFKRDLNIPADVEKPITIIGLRRAGKTHYLYQIIKDLTDKGLDKRRYST